MENLPCKWLQFMTFHRAQLKSSDTNIHVFLSNIILEQVTFNNFFAVIIDNNLPFERHQVYSKNTISKGLGILTVFGVLTLIDISLSKHI